MVTKGHFSWDAILNVWTRLLFRGDGFANAQSIDSAMLSLENETFLQMSPWFWRSIPLAASWMQCSLWETLEKLFFALSLFCMRRALLRVNLHILLLCMCTASKSGCGKFRQKLQLLSGKIRKTVFVVLVFKSMRESRTFEKLAVFLEHPTDFDNFPEQIWYSQNGRHVWNIQRNSASFLWPWPWYLTEQSNFYTRQSTLW